MNREDGIDTCPYSNNPPQVFINGKGAHEKDEVKLKYCVRTKHSIDMPLKHPRKNCSFKEGRICSYHPCHIRYNEENGIKTFIDFATIYICVLEE